MKVFFDQNAPRPLARFLARHTVVRAVEQGWAELKNGELLLAVESAGFDVFVTADRNLSYQQNLDQRTLAIVVLPSGQWPELQPHVAAIVRAVDTSEPGSFIDLTVLRPGKG